MADADSADAGTPKAATNAAGRTVSGTGLANVRVNNPAEDTHFVDQTTQSETAIGVHGANVVVGFNDSQDAPLFLTAAANLTGYGYR